ncbi:uncharacterized protein Tco025E_06754 [Trypanosoma conorhini]|uniref:Uncharacterized protein n=1 Tax=Trypanosoma conorhini TaxID=83891 RepID=A0A3R7M7W6_9TRYP|nr:uncharacterized protein Tco025E_06754 [Trypanosoma conorhini]RNF10674.1 hypothetical protein Tco025E_06754 [Trypanosoma conorhini]
MLQWLWAWSRGWGGAQTLRALHSWFHRGGGDVEASGDEEGESVLDAILRSPSSEDASPGHRPGSQRVGLTNYGKAHVFLGDDAETISQSFAGVNEAGLCVTDAGDSVSARVVDVPGSVSRELLRTHCLDTWSLT